MRYPQDTRSPLEVWGGIECSRVRLVGRVEDQLARTGHDQRFDDLERFAGLGLRSLRYPILWELHAQEPIDWSWADARLNRLRELGIRPIVGFVHHGSGPLPNGLLDEGFVAGLSNFAGAFAQRFPWIDAYTPVNEPLTTARFSGFYGLWHPFGRDAATFSRILLHECLAVRGAMEAIRAVTPHAMLIQTEDLGKTHSTPALGYQADFENERRWLTFDLLCGRLQPGKIMHDYLVNAGGLSPQDLRSFAEAPCPPDICGVNYYVTSERFLDERLDRYPPECRGGNERQTYADVPAVRVRQEGLTGLGGLLAEAWARYRLPLAVTEVQLACTREEQLRWLRASWESVMRLRSNGVDVRAITAWGLLGAYDWSSLLVEPRGHYEGGAFDLRSTPPRATALVRALQSLAATGDFSHVAISGPGWWERDQRLEFPAVSAPHTGAGSPVPNDPAIIPARPILIFGASGMLGGAFIRICRDRGLHAIAIADSELDLNDARALGIFLERHDPWAVVNAGSYANIDQAEIEPGRCFATNVLAPALIAAVCEDFGCAFLTFSNDQVFPGGINRPYVESDLLAPLNYFGRSQCEADLRVLGACSRALILRTGPLFDSLDENNFAVRALRRLQEGKSVWATPDLVVSPTYTSDLVNAGLDLLIDEESRVWHVANEGAVSWFEWAQLIAHHSGFGRGVIRASPEQLGWGAARPRWSALRSERGTLLPSLPDAVSRFLSETNNGGLRSGDDLSEQSNEEIRMSDGTNG